MDESLKGFVIVIVAVVLGIFLYDLLSGATAPKA